MTLEITIGGVVLVCLVLYALTGGADFGGGVWDLLARGRSAGAQRDLIARAIAPVWEANHVWLILAIVLVFVCFPLAFAAIGTALHVPLALMLIGIVLRGSAFVFRSHDRTHGRTSDTWSRTFAIASTVTPVMLGVCAGAIASGRIRVDPATGHVATNFVSEWLAPFPIGIGLFTLALFALLAAVYLTVEARDDALREAFRRRALGAAMVTGALAFGCLFLAKGGAPRMHVGLLGRDWSLGFQVTTGLAAIACIGALLRRRYAIARLAVIAQVGLVVAGWGLAQFPYIVPPNLTLTMAAAPDSVLRPVGAALAIGAVVLLPSLAYLMRVFKFRER